MIKIAVIGAGLSGLTLARSIQKSAKIDIFEKSKGLGGRMSHRRANINSHEFSFDHGAQYFTARSTAFKEFLDPFLKNGTVKQWHPKIVIIKSGIITPKEKIDPLYIPSPAMNALAKTMGDELPDHIRIYNDAHINQITKHGTHWRLSDKKGIIYDDYDWVTSAIPAPQAATLMPDCYAETSSLTRTKMASCFALMLGYDQPLELGFDAAFVENSPIGWIAQNHAKPNRSNATSLLIQTTNQWAHEHVDAPKDEIKEIILKEAEKLIGQEITHHIHSDIHRWLYANVSKSPQRDYLLDEAQQLASCGDWCQKGKVEAAFLSGYQLAKKLNEIK